METKALYIHIPFCDHICSYCDFAKVYYREEFVLQYLERLKEYEYKVLLFPYYILIKKSSNPLYLSTAPVLIA